MDFKKKISRLLKTYRNLKGYTQQNIADITGIAQTQYSAYELGDQEPSYKNLEKLINALEIPIEKFFKVKPFNDETFEKFADDLNNATELYEFITYYAANKKELKGLNPVAVFEELAKIPQNKRRRLMKELRRLRAMVEIGN